MANYVKFRRGRPEAFQVILNAGQTEPDTLYFIYEEDEATGELYLGSKLIAGGSTISGASTLALLQDVLLNSNLSNTDCLVYDINQTKWVNKPIADILPTFVGTNGESNAVAGLVPAPTENNPNLFLRSDGQWTEIVVASDALVLQTIVTNNESHENAIARIVEGYTVNKGDIISFISQDDENYGQIITHKVRDVLKDSEGEVAFITYGTTTGATDPWVVTSKNVVGEYEFSIPKVGHMFKFLKSPLGYVFCILIPFLILILLQAKKCMELYKNYKREIAQEKKAHKDENMALKEEVAALRQQLSEIQKNEKEN